MSIRTLSRPESSTTKSSESRKNLPMSRDRLAHRAARINPIGTQTDLNRINVKHVAALVHRAPQDQVCQRRVDESSLHVVAAPRGEILRGLQRVLMLPQAEQQVGAGQHQAGTGQARFAVPEAENQRDDQHQGKYRVDDPDDAPCDTGIAEGLQQLGAVAGAGIE